MQNTIFFLVGYPGVGKLTTAKAIGELTGARVVDNHYANNPIFKLIELYRDEPLPQAVWDRIGEVHRAILETIATLSPGDWSFVFTLVAHDDDTADRAAYLAIRDVARRRGALFQPVRLICDIQELARRVVTPERKLMLKDVSAANALIAGRRPLLRFDESHALQIDTTHLSAVEAARRVVAAASELR